MGKVKIQITYWISERFHKIYHVLAPSVLFEKFLSFVKSITPMDHGHQLKLREYIY